MNEYLRTKENLVIGVKQNIKLEYINMKTRHKEW